ncbi:hypothetical protein CR161_11690 [Prosthecochloris sp. ZM]|uniref:hypothetical protein n=1 Tax=Prosthecochloris sp. ZM TaxID=2283143 RepID=UPI000DF728FE|nr:hypothetical protein [Prosthecochloris sp. ZM]RDD31306.1 hypothetical protein CR161_11690 [Prosthecochloris sp. ZM]
MIESINKLLPVDRVASVTKAAVMKAGPAAQPSFERIKKKLELSRNRASGLRPAPIEQASSPLSPSLKERFSSLLRLRTFGILVAVTVCLTLYINNLLTINALSAENEILREKISISRSINAALEVELQEYQTIHRISSQAEKHGLRESAVPAVKIFY